MAWTIEFERDARKDLDRIDAPVARSILRFLSDRVAPLDDPRAIGEALKGSKMGDFWKYRVGDYRIIAHIEDDVVRIIVLRVAHRRDVYR